jgi:Uma2 family endonuclease
MALPDDGHHYEIVNGELIDMGNSGALHGHICSTLMILLGGYVRLQNLGAMLDSSTAFKMKTGNKRSPDLAFISKERLPGLKRLPKGFFDGAPDLAVEIISPNNTFEEITNWIKNGIQNGFSVTMVLFINRMMIRE